MNVGTGPKAQFFPNLEAARGIAALMVALFHIGQAYFFNSAGLQRTLIAPSVKTLEFTWSDQLFRILGNGPGAVVLFFVLSGFVLTLVLQQGADRGVTKATLFFLARICRIYPAVITSIVIFVALFFFTGLSLTSPEQYSPWIIFLNGLLLSTTIDGVMWSLQLELIAAPVIFLVWLAWMRFGNKALTVAFVVLVILSFTRTWNHLIGPPAAFGQLHAFIAGMAAFLCGRKIVDRLHHPALWLDGNDCGVCSLPRCNRLVVQLDHFVRDIVWRSHGRPSSLRKIQFSRRENYWACSVFRTDFVQLLPATSPHNDLIRQRCSDANDNRQRRNPPARHCDHCVHLFGRGNYAFSLAAISICRAAVYQIRSGTAV